MHLSIYTDGGARGNPGPAAIGFVIKSVDNKLIVEDGQLIGDATNNTAEYKAVIAALNWFEENKSAAPATATFFLDSNLVVNQLIGNFKIKKIHLNQLAQEIHAKLTNLGITAAFQHIPREKNYRADYLLNQALDSQH